MTTAAKITDHPSAVQKLQKDLATLTEHTAKMADWMTWAGDTILAMDKRLAELERYVKLTEQRREIQSFVANKRTPGLLARLLGRG